MKELYVAGPLLQARATARLHTGREALPARYRGPQLEHVRRELQRPGGPGWPRYRPGPPAAPARPRAVCIYERELVGGEKVCQGVHGLAAALAAHPGAELLQVTQQLNLPRRARRRPGRALRAQAVVARVAAVPAAPGVP